VITSITPASGDRGGSSSPNTIKVTITGTVLFGATLSAGPDIAAVITSNDGSTIVANFGISATATLGPVNVILVTPSGDNKLTPPAFNITAPAPTLATITPAVGSAASTLPVTLVGTGLTGATLNLPAGITLSGIPAVTQTSISATLVIAASAPGTTGSTPVNISVTTPAPGGGTSANLPFMIAPQAKLSTSSTHVGNFTQAQAVAVYTVKVTNDPATSATIGPVTVTETVTSGLTLVSMNGGPNWTCGNGATCTRSDALAGGASYDPITVTVSVSAVAVNPQSNSVSVSGGNSSAAAAPDPTTIVYLQPTLTNVSPARGVIGTSLPVTFTGTNLINSTGAAGVMPASAKGITVSNVVFVDTTQITALITIDPLSAPFGPQDIQVGVLGGVTNPMSFTVVPLTPVLSSIYPLQAVTGISQPAIVTGNNLLFLAGLNVFDASGAVATGITVSAGLGSSTQIPATLVIAATAAPGTYTINVATLYYPFSNSITFTVVAPPATAAAFVKTDPAPQGAWTKVYGADGQAIANDIINYPLYAKVALAGQTPLTWQAVATDPSALLNGAGTGGIASSWFSATSFTIDINLTDGLPHQVAMSCVDWLGNNARVETIDVLDDAT
jgi:hypothetical protein